MLRKIRIFSAVLFFLLITLLLLDFSGTLHGWLDWMAHIQLLPAILAVNVSVVVALLLLTLLVGRVYCSVICPLGVMQDVVSWVAGRRKKFRFVFTPEKRWLRWGVLVLFVAALLAGVGSFFALLEPYSAYGRIVASLFAPVYDLGNNVLAYLAERADSYAFYRVDIWLKSLWTLLIAGVTFVVLFILAWRGGRTYCNTICPVGTILGFVSHFALFKPRFDLAKCNGCKVCARKCKASCIDPEHHEIDYSRCVACMDCLENCNQQAIVFSAPRRGLTTSSREAHSPAAPTTTSGKAADTSRRKFLAVTGLLAVAVVRAQEKKLDGGLALIEDKKVPDRAGRITPAGSRSVKHMYQHCTGCQLCITACPNQVLRPSAGLMTLMQPEMSFERGYCRPECTKCSEVCPAGAIRPITVDQKSSTQIGHAVWIRENCLAASEDVACNNCARHCPVGAIRMVRSDPHDPKSIRIPAVNEERCIGCGACENLCPARPFSAIYVEGHLNHKLI